MTLPRFVLLAAAATAMSISSSYAGPCSLEIAHLQGAVDAMLAQRAATGPSAPESINATMHRQPTPASVAAAEARVGGLWTHTIMAVTHGMTRARLADRAGNPRACRRAVAEVQHTIVSSNAAWIGLPPVAFGACRC